MSVHASGRVTTHNKSSCHKDKQILCLPGPKGHDGPPGIPGNIGPSGPIGIGELPLLNQNIVPTDNTTILTINPQDDVVTIDTSTFSPTLNLDIPTGAKFITLKLLNQHGLPATVNLNSGQIQLNATIPIVTLLWDGNQWSVA